MKHLLFSFLLLAGFEVAPAQQLNKIIKIKAVKKLEQTLAADNMEGRKTFTPGIAKAAAFIASAFKKAGLQPFHPLADFNQQFFMYQSVPLEARVVLDGNIIPDSLIAVFSYAPTVSVTEKSGMEIVQINKSDNFIQQFYKHTQSKKNLLVLVDTSFKTRMRSLKRMERISADSSSNAVVFVLTSAKPANFVIQAKNTITEKPLNNVVGFLPGKSKPDEYVIFSAHYDHLGIANPQRTGVMEHKDSIFNGANDDAAGTAAVIMLAKYFKKLNTNERSLIFVAFTAEEMGGYGSKYFSKQVNPEKVKAMFNIEMIGTASKWGLNAAYITGFEKTDLGAILQKNLAGTAFTFHPDPYSDQQLFYRSDNATLARLGVPAHTISTSKMDSEPNYHKVSDEIATLDLKNMTEIIKAIAISATTIVSGVDTPSRVDQSTLR